MNDKTEQNEGTVDLESEGITEELQQSKSEHLSEMAQAMADMKAKATDIPPEITGTASVMTEEGMSVLTQPVPGVPDIETGGQRALRMGCYLSIQPVPYLDKQVAANGPMFIPRPPVAQFIMADSWDKILARVVHEVDSLLKTTEIEVAKIEEQDRADAESGLTDSGLSSRTHSLRAVTDDK
jgi:hypothetical protein